MIQQMVFSGLEQAKVVLEVNPTVSPGELA
jgi:hypothetical protein